MVALAPFDFQAHDTFFVVGHLHYVLIGGALFPIVAGCYYFFPLINGKKLSDRLGKIAFWLTFIGFNVAFLPMHLTGLRGMPRRVFTYPAGSGLRRAQSRLDHRRVHPGGGPRRRRLGPRSPEREAAVLGAQSVGRRHAGMAAGDARQAVGRALDPGDRQPLSALGSAELRARRGRGPLLPARRRRGEARNDRHLGHRRAARAMPAAARADASSRCGPR